MFSEVPDDPEFLNNMFFTKEYVKTLQNLPGGDEEYAFQTITLQTLQQTACAVQKIEEYQKQTKIGAEKAETEWAEAQKHAVEFTRKLREMLNQAVNLETLTMTARKLPSVAKDVDKIKTKLEIDGVPDEY